MALSIGGSFPDFISNVIIVDDAIHAHNESKKGKVLIAPSGSAPLKYQMVYHHRPTYQPHQHPQQHQH
jgi:hypothetical protein